METGIISDISLRVFIRHKRPANIRKRLPLNVFIDQFGINTEIWKSVRRAACCAISSIEIPHPGPPQALIEWWLRVCRDGRRNHITSSVPLNDRRQK